MLCTRLAAERQLATLESFIQECLHVMTMMSGSVAQQLLYYLQDETTTSQLQHVHPQRHSPASTVDSVRQLCMHTRMLVYNVSVCLCMCMYVGESNCLYNTALYPK